uniref:Uncharacterized protein n=1 Tax=Strombidinopsis acuminata TaxID=141414 RepID=A0A7S3T609_9SPIT|mmetsp:Transcript_55656/g.76556  ORF Transcript_55656/g.76556 Transcript_55656/m.76556 type:complete len:111 (+) Transcript_55656:204-536(+)
MYNRVRSFKIATFFFSGMLGAYHYLDMTKKMTYYDRFYPEATELQKTLNTEAQIFKENKFVDRTVEEKRDGFQDPEIRKVYEQMYQLPPQRHADPEERDPNAGRHAQHWG